MFSKRLKFVFFMVLLAGILALVGCSSKTESSSSGGTKSKLDKVVESGKLRVATFADIPGWSILNESGEYEGFDPDIARKLAEELGVEVEFVTTDNVNRIPLVESDKVDVVIATFTPTNERAKSIAFTEPYAAAGLVPLYKDTPIEKIEDLADKKIVVARSSTGDMTVTEKFPDADITRLDDIADAVMAVESGKADVFVDEQAVTAEIAKKNPELKTMPGEPYQPQYLSMGIQKGDADWLNYLNTFIRNITYSGETSELYQEWFDSPLPELYPY